MKLALECPINMLEMVQAFGDFDFILAHLVLKDEKYRKFYAASSKRKILDNSTNELGEPISNEDMAKAQGLVKAHFIVAPDWIGDAERTMGAYPECVKTFGQDKVIGVVQGASFLEALDCVNFYGKGSFIAIPYDICSKKDDAPSLMALRRALLVSNIPNDRLVHLLGLADLNEFIWYEGKPHIVSIDTGVPVLLGLQGKDILDPIESKAKATYNEMEGKKLGQEQWTGVCRNIALLRRFLP